MSRKRPPFPFQRALKVGVEFPAAVTALQYFLQGRGILQPRTEDSPMDRVAVRGVFDESVMLAALKVYQRRVGRRQRVVVNGVFGPRFWRNKMPVTHCASFMNCLARAWEEAAAAADERSSSFPPTAFPATSGPAPGGDT